MFHFVYNGYKLIEELGAQDNSATSRRYTWQPNDVGLDVPLSAFDLAENKTYFYHTDANKNVTELTDSEGTVVAHYEYSPFGMVTKLSGDYAATNPFRFSSEYHDSETGLVYYNYRYYDPQLGRWLSRDPIEEVGGYNLYGIVNNSIINRQDDLGLIFLGYPLMAKPVVARPTAWYGWGNSAAAAASRAAAAAKAAADAAAAAAADAMPKGPVPIILPRASGKEAADDLPSWAEGTKPCPGKSSEQQTKDMLDNKYGPGNWNKGPGSEYNKIKKFLDRYNKRHNDSPGTLDKKSSKENPNTVLA